MKTLFLFSTLFFFSATHANVVGTHLQNFNPTTNGLDFVTVQSSQTLAPGMVNLGFWTDYAFNSLPFFKAPGVPNTQKFSEPNDKLLSSVFNLGLGLTENWDAGLSLPFILSQSIGNSTQLGSFDEKGLTEVRINTKYRVFKNDTWAAALIASVNFDRIKNNPFTGSDAGPTWNLEAAVDRQLLPGLNWAFNGGYRLRDRGQAITDTGVTPLANQIIYSSALSYLYPDWNTHFIFELYGSTQTQRASFPTDRKKSNLEVLAGAKYSIAEKMVLHGGLTTEAYHGLATPDLRIYLGLNWQLGPLRERAAPPIVEEKPVIIEKPIVVEEEPPSEVIVLHSINFNTADDEMTAQSRADFQSTIQKIKNNTQTLRKIIVEGHTDSRGTDAYNQNLSQRRANSVLRVLRAGLGSTVALEAVGKGESRPIDRNETDRGRAKNRRVELKIYRNK